MVRVFVGLGGNVGDVDASFARALALLRAVPGVIELRLSSRYVTAPVGPVADQPAFTNAVAELQVDEHQLGARALLDALLTIERAGGRARARETPQGPRTLDLDLLLWGDQTIAKPGLTVPHPRLADRAFALAPLVELADVSIPGLGRASEALAKLRDQAVRRIDR